MVHAEAAVRLGHLGDQSINIRKRPGIAPHFSGDLRRDATETGQIKIPGFLQHQICHRIGEAAAEVSPAFVLLHCVFRINHIQSPATGVSHEAWHVLRGILQVIVYIYYPLSPRLPIPRQHGIVFSIVSHQIH